MSDWFVRIGEEQYPAPDRETIKAWWRARRIDAKTLVFDPEKREWITLVQFAEHEADGVLLATTPLLDGYRITRYITVDLVIGATWNIVITTDADVEKIRHDVLLTLRSRAVLYSGNAVIGLKVDFISAGFVGPVLIASGTVVEIEPSAAPAPAG